MGALTNCGAPSWLPAPAEVLARCAQAAGRAVVIPEIIGGRVHFLDPGRRTYPWLSEGAFPGTCDADRCAADAPALAGAIVVEAGAHTGHVPVNGGRLGR
jgi:hypothetical protein